MKIMANDNKVGKTHLQSETVAGGHPEQAADDAGAVAADGDHMRKAVDVIVKHNKLMEEQPELHAKATAHVKKHGHKKAMDMLPKPKINNLNDLRTAAKNMSKSDSEGGDYKAGM